MDIGAPPAPSLTVDKKSSIKPLQKENKTLKVSPF